MDDIRGVLDKMPAKTDLERRDRALVAFAILSGARDDAMASFSLKHVELAARTIFQDARDVRTKNRKSFTSEFFPVGDDIETIVGDWIEYLARERNFGPDDPLFPATGTGLNGEGLFCAAGLSREHWKNASAIRRIFKGAFEAAGLPYANPHSFRKTLTLLGQRICSPEQFKAWSQNLGHEHVLTTYCSYGTISPQRQAEIFASLRLRAAGQGNRSDTVPDGETIRRVLDHIKALAPA